jgi:MFS transporter, OFA family, oxalate/formate antiporter
LSHCHIVNRLFGCEIAHSICALIANFTNLAERQESATPSPQAARTIMEHQQRQAWTIVAVLFATMFLIWGPVNASGVFFVPVVKHFGWSRGLFSLLVAAAPLAAGLSSPVIGSLLDRFGERRIMMTGAALVALSYLALSRADSAAAFLAIFVVLGVGVTASTIIPSALVITNWFPEQRGLALGIAFAGIPLGGTGISILASHVVLRFGFRAGYIAMALPMLVIVIPLLWMFMLTRPGGEEGRAAATQSAVSALPGLEVRDALRSRSFWLFAIAEMMFATAGVGIRVHLVPLLTGVGYSPPIAAEIFGAMFLFSALGSFLAGPLADRFGGRVTLAAVFLGGAAGIATLFGVKHLLAITAFVITFGLVRDTTAVLGPIAVGESLGVKRLGGLLGFLALFTTFGFALGPIIAGRIFDRSGSYTGALVIFVAMALTAMLAMRATLPLAEEKARIAGGEVAAA